MIRCCRARFAVGPACKQQVVTTGYTLILYLRGPAASIHRSIIRTSQPAPKTQAYTPFIISFSCYHGSVPHPHPQYYIILFNVLRFDVDAIYRVSYHRVEMILSGFALCIPSHNCIASSTIIASSSSLHSNKHQTSHRLSYMWYGYGVFCINNQHLPSTSL